MLLSGRLSFTRSLQPNRLRVCCRNADGVISPSRHDAPGKRPASRIARAADFVALLEALGWQDVRYDTSCGRSPESWGDGPPNTPASREDQR